jgi:hypothetical protein
MSAALRIASAALNQVEPVDLSGGESPLPESADAIDARRLLALVWRMDDLFVRSDPALRPAGAAPYSDAEWDALREAVRRELPKPSIHPARSRLLILSCSARKDPNPERIPAIQRYDGPLWQTLRTVDPDGKLAQVAFLSAHYGFRVATTQIERYDAIMTPERAKEMIDGGTYTRWPRPKSWKRQGDGQHAETQMHFVTRDGLYPISEVAIVGGALYLEVMRSFVAEFRAKHYLTEDACVTEINGTIGRMRQQLREWLLRSELTCEAAP